MTASPVVTRLMAIPEMDGGAIWSVVPVDDQVVPESVEKQTLPVAALASVIVNAFVAVPDATALNATAPPPIMSGDSTTQRQATSMMETTDRRAVEHSVMQLDLWYWF